VDAVILGCGGANALLQYHERERALAFEAPTGALALLAGLKTRSFAAREAETDELSGENAQCLVDHRCGVVVRLSER
jgi:hypothetical protein